VQLLWVNMMTAVLLGLILVFEPKESGLMHRPPRPAHKPILTGQLAVRTGLVTLIMIVGAFWLFSWEMSRQGETIDAARTAVINVIVLIETAYLFNCRSLNQSFFTMRFFSNPLIIVGACAMLGVQLLFTYTPVMNRLFHTAPISVETWLRIAGVAILAFSVVEIEKWLRLRYQGNRE